MQKTVLLIDINNIFAKFYFAGKSNPESTFSSDKCSDLIISFIFDAISYCNATHCCSVFDADGQNFRYQIYPDYKKTRKPKPEDYDDYRNILKNRLRGACLSQISSKSLEAEDSLNLIIGQYNKRNDVNLTNFIVISDDKDCQLLKVYPNCRIYKKANIDRTIPSANKNPPIVISGIPTYCKISESDPDFIDKFKLFFSLNGDSTDNIPGVPNFGEIKSNFIVSKFKSYQELKNFITSDSLELDSLMLFNPDDTLNITKCLLAIKKYENLLDVSYKLFSLYDADYFIDIDKWIL